MQYISFNKNKLNIRSYIIPFKPLDFHCHGVGKYDFTEINTLNLDDVENILTQNNINCILTLYLSQQYFNDFLVLVENFYQGKQVGRYEHIVGVALEGPMLSSHGGTPANSVWYPSMKEWEMLATCGEKGLLYVVLSPDIHLKNHLKFEDMLSISELLLDGGVFPSPGHFLKSDPEASAMSVRKLLDLVSKKGKGPTVSDHLFNDMPRNFKHAWRTSAEKSYRTKHLEEINLTSWDISNLEEKVGHVPAALMRGALDGLIKPCLNFDGEHVDIEISKRVVEIVGASNLIAMTDRIESKLLGGQKLINKPDSSLLYQDEGIVAAGSNTIEKEMENMRNIGISEADIWQMFAFVPYKALGMTLSHGSV